MLNNTSKNTNPATHAARASIANCSTMLQSSDNISSNVYTPDDNPIRIAPIINGNITNWKASDKMIFILSSKNWRPLWESNPLKTILQIVP